MVLAARMASAGRSSGWFSTVIVDTGRLPLFCFFVAFLVSFALIRLSVRMIRAEVSWWPGNVTSGGMHLHHMVFGVILMVVAGVADIAAPLHSVDWRAGTAGVSGSAPPWSSTSSRSSCTCATCTGPAPAGYRSTRSSSPPG